MGDGAGREIGMSHLQQEPARARSSFLLGLLHLLRGVMRPGLFAACLAVAPYAQAFDLQAHRGGRGLRPENTLVSFEHAIRMGVTTLELDIAITADDVAVITHDPALNPALTRDARGDWLSRPGPLIHNLTLAQLQAYDVGRLNPAHPYGHGFPEQQARDGTRMPTLASLFKLVQDAGATDIRFAIETKIDPRNPANTPPPDAFVKTLLGVIRDAGMVQRVMVQSFDWRTLALLQQLEPQVRTVYLTVESAGMDNTRDVLWTAGHMLKDFDGSVPRMVRAAAGKANAVTWAPFFGNLTSELLRQAQALGLQVIPWTVNDKLQMERLIDWGVDGIISDYPDRLRDVMAKKGLTLPKGVPN